MGIQGQILFGEKKRRKANAPRVVLLLALVLGGAAAAPHIAARGLPRAGAGSADALFVLSGGEGRIDEGYRAWRDGKAKELYIIGAGEHVRIGQILPGRILPLPDALQRVHIEGWSENTLENAFSVKSAVKDRRFRSLILLTSDYHLPRAYFAVRKVVPPDVGIAVMSVRSGWRARALPTTLRRHVIEGWKYWGYRLLLLWE